MKKVSWIWVLLVWGCWSADKTKPVVQESTVVKPTHSKQDNPAMKKAPPELRKRKVVVPLFKVPKGDAVGASFEFKGRQDAPVPMSCVRRPMNRRSGMACYGQYRWQSLSEQQAKGLVGALRDGATFDDDAQAACFDPRMGFAWYDQKGQALLQVGVCLKCNNVRIEGVDEKGQPVRWVSGLSVKGVERLRQMCQKLGLAHCKDQTYLEKMQAAEASED